MSTHPLIELSIRWHLRRGAEALDAATREVSPGEQFHASLLIQWGRKMQRAREARTSSGKAYFLNQAAELRLYLMEVSK